MIRKVLFAIVASILAFGGVSMASPAMAATCTATLGQNCGPYDYAAIPMSNGFDTYVSNQQVNVQPGTTQTITATDPGSWSMVANDKPYGFTGVQTFDAVQQLTNDWNGSGWGSGSSDTPLSALSSLTVTYNETSPQDANSIYEFAPDVWDTAAANDVMFWADTSPTRCTDNGLGAGDILGQAVLGGQNWTVYHYGTEIIIILDGTSSTDPVDTGTCAQQSSGTIDILGGYQWLVDHGVQANLGNLTQLNTGWEVTSADNTTFTMNSLSYQATIGGQQQNPPPVPSGLSTSGITQHTATAHWASEPQAASFHLQLWKTANPGVIVRDKYPAGGSTSWHWTKLAKNTSFTWRIAATNANGTSAYSPNVTFRTAP